MRIASTTLAGSNATVIRAAIDSVLPFVDVCILIDTAGDLATIEEARRSAGNKLLVREFPWCDDFAAARNFALECAADDGCQWALTVDTDERIHPNGELIDKVLRSTAADALMMTTSDGTYSKARALRVPSKLRYRGATHEVFPTHEVTTAAFAKARFYELPKSPDQLLVKWQRDERILRRLTEPGGSSVNPDPRSWFYLGETLRGLASLEDHFASGERSIYLDDARRAYDQCQRLNGWSEEAAWACYQGADCLMKLGDTFEALRMCATGLAHHAGVAELAWLAGLCAYKLGRWSDAISWSDMAIVGGLYRGRQPARIGFRHLPGLFEGPYDVKRWTYTAMGEPTLAERARQQCEAALAQRLETK